MSATVTKNELHVLKCAAFHRGGWRPFKGVWATAARLERQGLLKECGFSVMPPNVEYVITDDGMAVVEANR